jgi:tetratricopeptide (TPR) repeat protein
MKKTLFVIGILLGGMANAQNDAVTNAFFFNKDGELDKAKAEIDRAAVHEKTKDKAKTWYFRGLIYENILNTKNEKFLPLAANAGKDTYESFAKAMSLSQKGDEYYDNSLQRINGLWGTFLNEGIKRYENKDFAGSIASYELAQTIKPADTTAFVYALFAADAMQDFDKASTFTRKLFSMGRSLPYMYLSLARMAKKMGKTDVALSLIQEGRSNYPTDKNLALDELDLYFASGRGAEVKAKLEEAIRLEPNNANMHSILGNLYDQEAADTKRLAKDREDSKQKAIASYRKAIELDPLNMEANYNMGVYYFNRAADILKKVNDLNIGDYQRKGKAMEADAKKEFAAALPFFEACYKKDPNDAGARKSLKNTLIRLDRQAEAEKIPD